MPLDIHKTKIIINIIQINIKVLIGFLINIKILID